MSGRSCFLLSHFHAAIIFLASRLNCVINDSAGASDVNHGAELNNMLLLEAIRQPVA